MTEVIDEQSFKHVCSSLNIPETFEKLETWREKASEYFVERVFEFQLLNYRFQTAVLSGNIDDAIHELERGASLSLLDYQFLHTTLAADNEKLLREILRASRVGIDHRCQTFRALTFGSLSFHQAYQVVERLEFEYTLPKKYLQPFYDLDTEVKKLEKLKHENFSSRLLQWCINSNAQRCLSQFNDLAPELSNISEIEIFKSLFRVIDDFQFLFSYYALHSDKFGKSRSSLLMDLVVKWIYSAESSDFEVFSTQFLCLPDDVFQKSSSNLYLQFKSIFTHLSSLAENPIFFPIAEDFTMRFLVSEFKNLEEDPNNSRVIYAILSYLTGSLSEAVILRTLEYLRDLPQQLDFRLLVNSSTVSMYSSVLNIPLPDPAYVLRLGDSVLDEHRFFPETLKLLLAYGYPSKKLLNEALTTSLEFSAEDADRLQFFFENSALFTDPRQLSIAYDHEILRDLIYTSVINTEEQLQLAIDSMQETKRRSKCL
jgi:hypothetical protein